MSLWLIDENALHSMAVATRRSGMPTAENMANFTEASLASPPPATVEGGVARIGVSGVLTKNPDLIAMIFGGGNTTYPSIARALSQAEADNQVSRIELNIDSPGGTIDGLFELLDTMGQVSKPITARVSGMAASAAYAIAAQADDIVATNRAAQFGSVGVVMSVRIRDDVVDITSSNAPRKRPDASTEEGRAQIVEGLDNFEELFIDAIASGRGTTADKVKADFGQGGIVLAEAAVDRGMIDKLETAANRGTKTTTANAGGDKPEANIMDLQTLQAQHPDVYAAAVKQGEQNGATAERERVSALLTKGEAAGAMDIALKAIQDGKRSTDATVDAEFFAAAMSKRDIEARNDDEAAAGAAADGAAHDAENDDLAEAAAVSEYFGLNEAEA